MRTQQTVHCLSPIELIKQRTGSLFLNKTDSIKPLSIGLNKELLKGRNEISKHNSVTLVSVQTFVNTHYVIRFKIF